jgi:predicted kinase
MLTEPRGVWLAIECACPAAVAQERICNRLAEGRDPSEARPDIHDAQQESWQAWPDCLPQLRVDTTRELTEQVAQVLRVLRERAIRP